MKLQKVILSWDNTFRVIPSKFPPVDFFEELVDASLMEELWYVESLTNDRLRETTGDISLVPPEDRVSGKGSSVIMAAFTHISIHRPSRFSNGTYGIYYAAKDIETALKEKSYHTERFLSYTKEQPQHLTMRVYRSKKIEKPIVDVRSDHFKDLYHDQDYSESQMFGKSMKKQNEWGIVYRSMRHRSGECLAILRPNAVPLPVVQTKHFNLVWNGKKITSAYELSNEILTL